MFEQHLIPLSEGCVVRTASVQRIGVFEELFKPHCSNNPAGLEHAAVNSEHLFKEASPKHIRANL